MTNFPRDTKNILERFTALTKRLYSLERRDGPLGWQVTDPVALEIPIFPGMYNVGTTVPSNVGNTILIDVSSTSAVYLCTFSVAGVTPGGLVNFCSFSIDGGPWNGDLIRTHSPQGNYFTVTRTSRIFGLSPGLHTIGIRSWNSVAGTTQHFGGDSTLTVTRIY